MTFRVVIITVSDRGASGERQDTSGPEIASIVSNAGYSVVEKLIVPDDKSLICNKLIFWSDGGEADLILTTGGTGVSPRDVTPDATLEVIEKQLPGLPEAMRRVSASITPHAMLSRAVAGIRGKTLIVNLPGSPKAARENLEVILPALPHAIEKIKGDMRECAS
jgi:molybdenum cofactor synthesis domain-containing protein